MLNKFALLWGEAQLCLPYVWLGFLRPMGPSTLAPVGSYIDTTELIERKGFKCIKPLNI